MELLLGAVAGVAMGQTLLWLRAQHARTNTPEWREACRYMRQRREEIAQGREARERLVRVYHSVVT